MCPAQGVSLEWLGDSQRRSRSPLSPLAGRGLRKRVPGERIRLGFRPGLASDARVTVAHVCILLTLKPGAPRRPVLRVAAACRTALLLARWSPSPEELPRSHSQMRGEIWKVACFIY